MKKITEMQIADEFSEKHKEEIRFLCPSSKWAIWDGKKWQIDEIGEITNKLASFISERINDYTLENESGTNPYHKFSSIGKIKNILELLKPKCAINLSKINSNDYLFNCSNGVINLKDEIKLAGHNKDFLITRMSDVEIKKENKCPEWLKFIKKITNNDDEYVKYFQRIVGYSLSGLTNEQCFFILYGNGMNGKTVFVEIIRKLLGEYACNAPRSFILNENENILNNQALGFLTSRLAILSETEGNSKINEKYLKLLAGSDTCSFKIDKETIEYVNKSKIFIITNSKPEINETTKAIWRRIHLLPFNVEVSEEDRDIFLLEKLGSELSGILNWAIEGFKEWQKHGLNPPELIKEETKTYKEEQDSVLNFIETLCIKDENKCITTSALYKDYKGFCEDNGCKLLTQIKFVEAIKARGYEKTRIRNERAIKGLYTRSYVKRLA